ARLFDALLDGLRRDVLAAGGFEQLLLAVCNAKVSFRVERADVAGLEPAVGGEDLLRSLRLVEVAAHDVGPARLDLAVHGDSHFDVAYGTAHRADAVVFRVV